MKTSTFQIILHSLRFLVAQLGIVVLALLAVYITLYLGAPKLVYFLIYLLLAGAYWPLARKIVGKEPGL